LKWGDWFVDAPGPSLSLESLVGGYMPSGYSICLRAAEVKAYQGTRAPAIVFNHAPRACNFVHRFCGYLTRLLATGYPVVGKCLFPRMMGPPSTWEGLEPSRLRLIIQARLSGAGCYAGETCHSFRRGSLQYAATNLGATGLALSALSQITTPSVMRKYLDVGRPTYAS
jgi:hypothetical protein